MGEKSQISWTDNTFNPWEGCTNVAPGCDNCYAEARNIRFQGNNWGKGAKRRVMSDANWKKPHRWQRQTAKSGKPIKVFCGSLCDWADNEAPEGQRERLWQVIRETPNLQWQLLTKRAPNIVKYLPDDWGTGYPNVWLGVTVENRKHGLPRIDILREIPAVVRFLSIEPLLEDLGDLNLSGIHWVIVGGESGPNARQMESDWVYGIQFDCIAYDVPFFFKQWGGNTPDKGGSIFLGSEEKNWPIITDQ